LRLIELEPGHEMVHIRAIPHRPWAGRRGIVSLCAPLCAGGLQAARVPASGPSRNVDPKNRKGVLIMKRLITLMLISSYVLLAGLAGCNTIQGAGKDVERGGEKIQKEAQENKKY
jgi:predicted small secreted protein